MGARMSEPALVEIHVGNAAFVASALACDFERQARRSIAERGAFTVAVPGGSVATRCFPALAALPLEWPRIELFWVDERAVAPDDPDSNYALALRLWVEPARLLEARVHRMRADAADAATAARHYARELEQAAGSPPRLDYVLLGTGPDGHVASLFPGDSALAGSSEWVSVVNHAPKPPPRRMTLTLPVLTSARRVAVVAFGGEKAEVIARCATGAAPDLPLARVLREAFRTLLLLDPAAAAQLPAERRSEP